MKHTSIWILRENIGSQRPEQRTECDFARRRISKTSTRKDVEDVAYKHAKIVPDMTHIRQTDDAQPAKAF
jgi:hypothetical protein